jgi:hypothetical protein
MSTRFLAVNSLNSHFLWGGTFRFYSTSRCIQRRKLHSTGYLGGNKKIKSKLNKKQLFITILTWISVGLLFTFPLKILCKLCGASFFVILILSGFIAYVNTKLYQVLKNKNINTSSIEFFRIFSINICLMFFMVVICYPLAVGLTCGFFLFNSGELSTLLKHLFNEIFRDKYLFMEDGISSYKVPYKPGKSTLNVAPILNMDSKGESSKTSSVYVDSTKEESSKSNHLHSNKSKLLPDPFVSRCRGNIVKFKMGLDWFGKDIPVKMEPIKNIADSPDAFTRCIPRLNGLDKPIELPELGIAPTLYNRNNATGAPTDYAADLRESRKHSYSRLIIVGRRS